MCGSKNPHWKYQSKEQQNTHEFACPNNIKGYKMTESKRFV